LGKLYFVETADISEDNVADTIKQDVIGRLKSKILSRTRFDGVIMNNAFKNVTPKFFYDLINVVGMKLKSEGTVFFSIQENRGLL
jgi:hypothetical protein